MLLATLLFKILVANCLLVQDAGIKPKKKVMNVHVLAPPAYISMYESTHPSLGEDLMAIALSFQTAFNNSVNVQSNGYQIEIALFTPADDEILAEILPSVCEGPSTNITDLLNVVNNRDNTHHYILLLPCLAERYAAIFNSVGVQVPIIEYSTNIECTKRIAIFFEYNFQQLYSAFSNALLKILNPPSTDYNTVIQVSEGDEGIKTSVSINDDTIRAILHNQCFLNMR